MKRQGRVENLQPVQTEEEAREKGRAGGIASGKARRAKKTWKELANIMLESKTSNANAEKLKALGISPDDATNAAVIVYKLLQKSQSGDWEATKLLAKITGNLEPDKIEVNAPVKIVMTDEYGTDEDYNPPSSDGEDAGDGEQ